MADREQLKIKQLGGARDAFVDCGRVRSGSYPKPRAGLLGQGSPIVSVLPAIPRVTRIGYGDTSEGSWHQQATQSSTCGFYIS